MSKQYRTRDKNNSSTRWIIKFKYLPGLHMLTSLPSLPIGFLVASLQWSTHCVWVISRVCCCVPSDLPGCSKLLAALLHVAHTTRGTCITLHRHTEQTDTHPNDRWCWTRAARALCLLCFLFFLFFSFSLFTAKGAYELISIANLRFRPGLSATPLRQWNANKYRERVEGGG